MKTSATATTSITSGKHRLPVSNLGPEDPLPQFHGYKKANAASPPARLSSEETEGLFIWGEESLLPYQLRDGYDRCQTEGELPAVFVENDKLKLTLYPTLGGRLASIFDKEQQRELLFCNPVFQPANLATLNAWFSGGIEWNAFVPGHTPFTCAPVFMGTVQTGEGPILRFYEFERRREATWQVDLFLPPGEAKLWIHVKLINPNTHPIKTYWWTNIAAPLDNSLRVLSPADYCIEHVQPDDHLEAFPFPYRHSYDGSYPKNYDYAASVFFRKPDQKRPWLGAVYGDGHAILHTSTQTLIGRKLFVFGSHVGGQRWMDYLSRPGEGNYVELQAGITPTQNQQVTMQPGEILEWTECIAPASLDASQTHECDYQHAREYVEGALLNCIPEEDLEQRDALLQAHSDQPVDAVLHQGRAWGMLREKLTGRALSTGLNFNAPVTCEQPWAELLENGTFLPETLEQHPTSWAVSDSWLALLQKSVVEHGTTWLHELLMGVIWQDRKEYAKAKACFDASISLKETYLARRHLALLALQEDDEETGLKEYLEAWKLASNIAPLAVEICAFLQGRKMLARLEKFLSGLPPEVLAHERVRLARTEVAMAQGAFREVRELLAGGFCTIREGEVSLTDLWFESHLKETEQQLGRPLTLSEQGKIKAQNPPPKAIDFRMTLGPS